MIKERDHPFGLWRLQGPGGEETVKVTGALASNHGEIVHQWCLDGQGVALRSAWDVKEHRQRQIGAHSAGVFSAGQHLGGVRFPAGNVGESAGDGRILRDYFREHYGETGRRVKIRRGPEAKMCARSSYARKTPSVTCGTVAPVPFAKTLVYAQLKRFS